MSSAINGLRQDMQTLIRVQAASGTLSAEQLANLNQSFERLVSETERQSWNRAA